MWSKLICLGIATSLLSVVPICAFGMPIDGRLEFTSGGTFIVDGTSGEAVGFDFYGTVPDGDGVGEWGEQTGDIGLTTGAIATLLGLPSNTPLPPGWPLMEVYDFDLRAALPTFEWIVAATGVDGPEHHLRFAITSGHEVDETIGDPTNFDLAGTGLFSLVCVDTAALCSGFNAGYETTTATWSLSNAGGFLVTGVAVPEPATLGMLGLGLIIWSRGRRRSIFRSVL